MNIQKKIKELQTDKKASDKEIDAILAYKSTDTRAKAAYKLWLKLNPMCQVSFSDGTSGWLPARRVHNLTIEKVKFLKEVASNDHNTNESGSMRPVLEMPVSALEFIEMFHPGLFQGDESEKKLRLKKLVKAFPELSAARRF